MAEAFRLLVPVPFPLVVVATAVVILLLEVFVSYERYSLILRWLALSIFAYVFELFVVNVDWSQVVAGLIPSFQPTLASIEALVAIFGTTISPYLFVWQAGEEVEERKAHRVGRIDARQIRAMRVDARALEPIAGRFASLLFAAGIVGTGLLAIPILAGSAAYALSETSGWREGLGRTPRQAPSFYGAIGASIVVGLALNFVGIDPIRALYVSAILNGLAAPPLILLMLILSNSSSTRLEGGSLSDGLLGSRSW